MIRKSTSEARPLSWVGQIELGQPYREGESVIIPLTYSGGEWSRNSAIVPYRVDLTLADRALEMSVETSVSTDGERRGRRLVLPGESTGEYTVRYRDPDGTRHEIGTVEIDAVKIGLPAAEPVEVDD